MGNTNVCCPIPWDVSHRNDIPMDKPGNIWHLYGLLWWCMLYIVYELLFLLLSCPQLRWATVTCVSRNISRWATSTFCLCFSGCWQCNANESSQNAWTYFHKRKFPMKARVLSRNLYIFYIVTFSTYTPHFFNSRIATVYDEIKVAVGCGQCC